MAYGWLIPIAGMPLWEEQQVKPSQGMQPKNPHMGLDKVRADKERKYLTDTVSESETPHTSQQGCPL